MPGRITFSPASWRFLMSWRLRRTVQIEREMMEYELRSRRAFVSDAEKRGLVSLGEVFAVECRDADAFSKLRRYEAHFVRALTRMLHELERRQASRKGREVTAPIAVDVTVDVAEAAGVPVDAPDAAEATAATEVAGAIGAAEAARAA